MEEFQLREEDYFGKGTHKKCYIHPENNKLCIKVIYQSNNGKAWKELRRELSYYLQLKKKNLTSEILPRYYGEVSTNLGPGYIYDIVRDSDNQISKELHHYLASENLLKENFEQLNKSLKNLKHEMLKEGVITSGLYPENILCKKDCNGEIKLLIVDNIGTATFIPIEYYFYSFARARIIKRWNRFIEEIKTRPYSTNSLIIELIKKIDL